MGVFKACLVYTSLPTSKLIGLKILVTYEIADELFFKRTSKFRRGSLLFFVFHHLTRNFLATSASILS